MNAHEDNSDAGTKDELADHLRKLPPDERFEQMAVVLESLALILSEQATKKRTAPKIKGLKWRLGLEGFRQN